MTSRSTQALPLHLGQAEDCSDFTLPLSALRRHLLALGGTGSGKSVFCKAVVEEAVRYNLPVIAVDLQGDLLSLAFQSADVPAGAVSPRDLTRAKLAQRMEVKVWTPGSSMGIPLSFSPSMTIPDGVGPEDRVRAIASIASDVAAVIGDKSEATVAGFEMVLDHADRAGHPCGTLDDLVSWLTEMPADLAAHLEATLPKRSREKLLTALAVKQRGANRLSYGLGSPIDVPELFGLKYPGPAWEGRARLSVIYLAHIGPNEQQTFLARLFSSIHRWMLFLDGQLQGLLYLDEISGLCPPVAKPPTKEGLITLLRQARKYGLCTILASQNPGDVDYKAIGQIGTIFLGRLGEDAGLGRVASMLRSVPGVDARAVMRTLAGQKPGEFTVCSPDHLDRPTRIRARWLSSEHRLVTEDEIRAMVSDEDRVRLGGAATLAQLGEVA